MEKQKKWQFFLILTVIALTIYNILPTVFYYCKPLKSPVSEEQPHAIAEDITQRVNDLDKDAKDWVSAFCNLLQCTPTAINPTHSGVTVQFAKSEDASTFRKFLPRAGAMIPFAPAQLGLLEENDNPKEVVLLRNCPITLDKKFFSYAAKNSAAFRDIARERAAKVAYALGGPSELAMALASGDPRYLETIASQINTISALKGHVRHRFAAQLTQGPFANREQAVDTLAKAFENLRDQIKTAKEKGKDLSSLEANILKAENFLKKNTVYFIAAENSLDVKDIAVSFLRSDTVELGDRNPLFSKVQIDWQSNKIYLHLHADIDKNALQQPIINEIAKIGRISHENGLEEGSAYAIPFHELDDTTGFLVMDLEKIITERAQAITAFLKKEWHPKHPDLQNIEIIEAKDFDRLPSVQKALSLVVVAHPERNVQIFAKGLDQVMKNYEAFPDAEPAQQFSRDLRELVYLLKQWGFNGPMQANDAFVFEQFAFLHPLLLATREDFKIKGKHALLELSDCEQRIIAANRIDTKIHEDLLKWQDEYNASCVSMYPHDRYSVVKPTKSVYWSNFFLSAKKFFRGDERKILHWGLDLSGGKTVQVELRDADNKVVTNEDDLKQAINELYKRVNKMGVSEVAIRQLGHHIVLDFPGSQSLSASELIKASSMYFHVVNERFSPFNPNLADAVGRFLQEVWNEAVVTNQKNTESINAIAQNHLQNDSGSEAAKILRENGLCLNVDANTSSSLDEAISKIAILRGSEPKEWMGQPHPLLVVFQNHVINGADLDNVHANYDPAKGNYLSFEVKGSLARNALQSWTSRFSKEKIVGTSLEDFSRGHGWRMAVVLNDTVISAPTLDAVIRDSASISGSFSQREVNQLAADLKAGSLTFTPHILSEKNVSPELGHKDRIQGITATFVSLLLVIGSMIAYYRFGGVVASIAVVFNLLILWATLQNIAATLSLAGIAGIILTVAMAVDANVLVFERIKEEFALTRNIASSIAAGYKKAYTAIIDSNLTTIIVALILLNFDAGPIKGFALTLIIGIASSMFTALFVTKYYFTGWAEKPKNQMLAMANWIQGHSINFLKWTNLSFIITIAIIAVGSISIYQYRTTMFGMDFTGGYSLQLELASKEPVDLANAVEEAFKKQGVPSRDFQVRTLNPSNHLRILFGTSMDQAGKPFHNMPVENDLGLNPRIEWVKHVVENQGLTVLKPKLLEDSWTRVSGQMSDSMRNNALLGLFIALVCIFIYIAFRFEYTFAAAATICLFHDVLITVGFMGLLHALGVPIQIDLNTVAALMTIVGYSLNDTIIIFDRIREEIATSRNKSLAQIINSALNNTLSRTSITSGTTLLVLIALVVLGGSSIFSFALVMTIGVFFGTLSSWYIASPLMLFFTPAENREKMKTLS